MAAAARSYFLHTCPKRLLGLRVLLRLVPFISRRKLSMVCVRVPQLPSTTVRGSYRQDKTAQQAYSAITAKAAHKKRVVFLVSRRVLKKGSKRNRDHPPGPP